MEQDRYTELLEKYHFVIIEPEISEYKPDAFSMTRDSDLRYDFMFELFKMRGSVYLQDGAISEENLDKFGKYVSPHDKYSWQVLLLDSSKKPHGGLRIRFWDFENIRAHFMQTHAKELIDRMDCDNQKVYQESIIRFLDEEMRTKFFGEVAGLVITDYEKNSPAALLLVAFCFAFGEFVGGFNALVSATERHYSNRIMRKIGGHRIPHKETKEYLNTFFDSKYNCNMEYIVFESACPAALIQDLCKKIQEKLKTTLVLAH